MLDRTYGRLSTALAQHLIDSQPARETAEADLVLMSGLGEFLGDVKELRTLYKAWMLAEQVLTKAEDEFDGENYQPIRAAWVKRDGARREYFRKAQEIATSDLKT